MAIGQQLRTVRTATAGLESTVYLQIVDGLLVILFCTHLTSL